VNKLPTFDEDEDDQTDKNYTSATFADSKLKRLIPSMSYPSQHQLGKNVWRQH
jgi:hypothetical protein